MFSRRTWAAAVVLLIVGGSGASAAGLVPVPGSGTQYTATAEGNVGGKAVRIVLTGVALRQKFFLNVYAIGSYAEQGAGVRTAEELAGKDCAKRLHLVMERAVSGKDMAASLQAAIRQNYPAPAFDAEVRQLAEVMSGQDAQKGEHIFLTHIPGVGLHCYLAGKIDIVIKNPAFTRAVWDIYLGRNNLGESIKKGLVSRL